MRNAIAEHLGRELRRARELNGLDREEVASELNLPVRRLQRIEQGAAPGANELAALCRLYELNIAVLEDRLFCSEAARFALASAADSREVGSERDNERYAKRTRARAVAEPTR